MNNYRGLIFSLLWRVILAVLAGAYIWKLINQGSFISLVSCVGLILLMAVFLAPATARLLGEPSGNLFYPGKRIKGPQPLYGIPETKRKQGLIQEAFDSYQKMSETYPQELKPYLGMMDIAVIDMKNMDLAESIHQHALLALKKEKDRDVLTKLYTTICSQHKSESHKRPLVIIRKPAD